METPDTPEKNEEEDEFIVIIQEYGEAVNGRNVEEQEAIMLKVFQHLEVVERRRTIAQLPQLEGPYKLNWLAVALRNMGKSLRQVENDEATEALEESCSIRRAIGLPAFEE